VEPIDEKIYLTPKLVNTNTGSFDTITVIDLDDKDAEGNPTVKTLSQPRTAILNREPRIEKRAIIFGFNDKKYVIVQGTKITTG
jgi:hypothetical protein